MKDNKRIVYAVGSAVLDLNAGAIPVRENWLEKQRIGRIAIQAGGDALNQATHLAALGFEAVLVTAVGGDSNGVILLRLAQERGIGVRYAAVKEGDMTGTSLVLVGEDAERHTFSVGGAYGKMAAGDLPSPAGAAAVAIASLFQMPELEDQGLESWLAETKRQGIPVFADLGSDKRRQGLPGIARFLPYLHTFLPSLEDAVRMTGAGDAESAAEIYMRAGARRVVIKCGAEGCFYASGQERGHIPALPVRPVDTTGAGDCFAAVYLSRILAGDGMADACRTASAAASRSTMYTGASEVPASELL